MDFSIQTALQSYSDLISPHSDSMVKANITPELCQKCKGRCCKRMGCEISPTQIIGISKTNSIEENTKIILKLLHTGIVSVDWWVGDEDREHYIRMRNKNGNVIDPSWGGECICLTETGCQLDAHYRPMAGLVLKCKERDGKFIALDDDHYDKENCKNEWNDYPVDWDRLVLEEDFYELDQIKDTIDPISDSTEDDGVNIRHILEFLCGL